MSHVQRHRRATNQNRARDEMLNMPLRRQQALPIGQLTYFIGHAVIFTRAQAVASLQSNHRAFPRGAGFADDDWRQAGEEMAAAAVSCPKTRIRVEVTMMIKQAGIATLTGLLTACGVMPNEPLSESDPIVADRTEAEPGRAFDFEDDLLSGGVSRPELNPVVSAGRPVQAPVSLRGESWEPELVPARSSPESIRRIVRSQMDRIRVCYERALQTRPALQGRVEMQFVIAADGTVAQARPSAMEPELDSVAACTANVLRSARFIPSSDGTTVTVNYPFVFQSDE